MNQEIVMAGFGGQGVMLIGQLTAYAGMLENKQVSWIPSYGPEMRGGTANCSVIVADEPIGSPIVTEANVLVALNLPSLDKFEAAVQPGGVLLINSSLIERGSTRTDIAVHRIPANDIANELGNAKTVNMIMLGALIAATETVGKEAVLQAFTKKFARKPQLIKINEAALERGYDYVKSGRSAAH